MNQQIVWPFWEFLLLLVFMIAAIIGAYAQGWHNGNKTQREEGGPREDRK